MSPISSERPPIRLWHNARLATLAPALPGLGIVEHGAVVARGDRIIHAGTQAELPAALAAAGIDASDPVSQVDCEGRWLTPGLIDCHTHLVHGGNRAREFEMRLKGATYEEIARSGGGILSTVRQTREASEDTLLSEALPRLDALIAEGVTSVEIKSGYGLDLNTERKMLRVARRLGEMRPIAVTTTFLGAHALPPEIKDKDQYIDLVIQTVLPVLAREGLVDAVDAFCEDIAFTPGQVSRVFDAAERLHLPVKLHADQLGNSGGGALAARYRALSADHLEHADEPGIAAMAAGGTIAVLLPGAFYFLREKQLPPIDLLRRHAVPIALATDCNPGTSPLTSLLLTLNLAATQFRLTVEECIAGITRNAARALGVASEVGTLEPGKFADLAVWDIKEPAELVYRMGFNPLFARIWRGR